MEDRLDNIAASWMATTVVRRPCWCCRRWFGSLLLSRSVKDEALSAELLSSTREQLKALTESA
ncbi:hypothetical protein ULF88_11105 [Halopseudomonas pachastrellae]|nr:hypothetical protein [Halopseudomonas pachastrellae]